MENTEIEKEARMVRRNLKWLAGLEATLIVSWLTYVAILLFGF